MVRRAARVSAFRDMRSGLTLEFRATGLLRAAANAASKELKRSLRAGVEPDGRSLPRGEDGGRALRDSGQLIRSIGTTIKRRRGRYEAIVWPRGTRADAGVRRNAALMAILIYGPGNWKEPRPRMDPMRPAGRIPKLMEDAAQREIGKQLARGKAFLKKRGLGRVNQRTVDRGFVRRLLGGR